MTMRSMIRPWTLLLAVVALLAPSALYPSDISLSVTTSAGILNGSASEIVYGSSGGQGYVQSKLVWALQPAYFVGTALTVETGLGPAALVSVRTAVPGLTGLITDSDWLNYNYGDTEKTHLSVHDCHTEHAVLLDVRLGWELRLGQVVSIEPYGFFSLMMLKWTARDGYLQYPPEPKPGPYTPWSAASARIPLSGTAIVYEQDWLVPGLGAALRFGKASPVEVTLSVAYSPLVWCFDLDNHEFRYGTATKGYLTTDYYDTMAGGMMLEPGIAVRVRIAERAFVALDVSYRYISGLLGDTNVVYGGPGWTPGEVAATYTSGAGAGYGVLSAALSFSLSL